MAGGFEIQILANDAAYPARSVDRNLSGDVEKVARADKRNVVGHRPDRLRQRKAKGGKPFLGARHRSPTYPAGVRSAKPLQRKTRPSAPGRVTRLQSALYYGAVWKRSTNAVTRSLIGWRLSLTDAATVSEALLTWAR